MEGFLLLVYLIAGYWATGKTIYANKVIIAEPTKFMTRRIALGFLFGWVLVPVAIIKIVLENKSNS